MFEHIDVESDIGPGAGFQGRLGNLLSWTLSTDALLSGVMESCSTESRTDNDLMSRGASQV